MILKQRIQAFARVGQFIDDHFRDAVTTEPQLHEGLEKVIQAAYVYNGWFTPIFVKHAVQSIGRILTEESLQTFCGNMPEREAKTVAVICAGNIPMVGFHDIMCVLLSGNKALIKLSSDDNVLLPFFLKLLTHYEPAFESFIFIADGKLASFDAVIATGSNNTATHFQQYFGKYPHIIRKNRTSVAILDGKETTEDIRHLGEDIFLYYGLGCRNVSKLFVPEGYSFNAFFEAILAFGYVSENKKYSNNYEYHRAIYLLEQHQFLDNNFVMVKESAELHSPVAVIHFSYYKQPEDVAKYIEQHTSEIQCVVGKGHIPFGYSQRPVISDFADGVNTLDFLVTL